MSWYIVDDTMNASHCDWNWTTESATCDNASTTNDDVFEVRYHSLDYRLVGSILVALIFVVGLTGNALVVAVVVRVPEMRSPTNWYLVSLALADIVLLVSAPLPTLVEYHVVVDQWVFGAGACSAAVFAQYLGVNMSSLSMTAFTVERYVAICHPFTARVADYAGRARRVTVTLWIAGIASVNLSQFPIAPATSVSAVALLLSIYAG